MKITPLSDDEEPFAYESGLPYWNLDDSNMQSEPDRHERFETSCVIGKPFLGCSDEVHISPAHPILG